MRVLIGYCLLFILLALMSCRQEANTPPSSVPVIPFKGLPKGTPLSPGPQANFVEDNANTL